MTLDASAGLERPPFDPKLSRRLSHAVSLIELQLVSSHFASALAGPLQSHTGFESPDEANVAVNAVWEYDDSMIGCNVAFKFSFADSDSPFELAARFRLRYVLDDDADPPSEDELASFAYFQASYNAWPYWREFVSSTLGRADLPPIVMPLLRGLPLEHAEEVPPEPQAYG